MYAPHSDFKPIVAVTPGALDAAAKLPVLRIAGFERPVVISAIEVLFNDGMYFVRVSSKCGAEGLSVANEKISFVHTMFSQTIAPYFIGRDARDLDALIEGVYVYKSNYKLAGVAFFSGVAFIETAILDMLGKLKGVPAHALLGEKLSESVSIYVASGNRGNSPEEELDVLRAYVERTAAKAIKFKIGGRMSNNADSIAGRSATLIRLVREAFGPDMIIHADGNGSYDASTAIRYGRMLEEIDAYFYEEPCPFDDLWETKVVADALAIPLAFGEQETSLRRFRWIVENGACRVLQPDILYNGGLIRSIRAARMAALAGITVTPHVSGGFGFVYVLHFAAMTPNIGRYQENKFGLERANELLGGAIKLTCGEMNIPDLPGFGIIGDLPVFRRALCLSKVL